MVILNNVEYARLFYGNLPVAFVACHVSVSFQLCLVWQATNHKYYLRI